MASLLLDSIINETVQGFTSRSDMFEDNPIALSRLAVDTTASTTTTTADLSGHQHDPNALDQLDQLVSMMQEVDMGQKERIFWILLFSLMVLVAAGGNIIVIYIVSTNKEMKSVTNYFLVNLSLADTMVSTLNVIFNFISMLNSHWPFGSVYCKISNFIAILSISASVFTLTAISCDRYNAILHPLRPRMSHRHAIGWILLIWTLSSALAMPNIIYSVVVEDRLVNENLALTCTMIWPDGRYPLSSYDHIYNIIILVVTYLVPILTMAILYYKVGKELWGYEAIGENVEKQARALMAKKKIVKMMIVVVIIFALCWLPYHAFFVVNYYLPTIFQDGPLLYKRCYLIMYWLAMSNSMYNPIIIYFMNSKFCHEFKRVLCLICCCKIYIPPMKSDYTSQNNHNSNVNHNSSARNLPHAASSSAIAASSRRLGNIATAQHELTTKLTNGSQLSSQIAVTVNNGNNLRQEISALEVNSRQSQHQLGPIEVIVTQSVDDDECNFNHLATRAASQVYDRDTDYDDMIIARRHANASGDHAGQLDRRHHSQNGLICNSNSSSNSSNSRDNREQKPFLKHKSHGHQRQTNHRPSNATRADYEDHHDTAQEVYYKF